MQIIIPKPCHENWETMLPTEKGAFCNACSKEVVDFTTLNDDEVLHYLIKNKDNNICGRIQKNKLKRLHIEIDNAIIYSNIAPWKKYLAIVLICFGSLLTSCDNKKLKEDKTTEAMKIEAIQTRQKELIVGNLYSFDSIKLEPTKLKCSNEPNPVIKGLLLMPYIKPEIIKDEVNIQGAMEIIITDQLELDTIKKQIDTPKKEVIIKKDSTIIKIDSCNAATYS